MKLFRILALLAVSIATMIPATSSAAQILAQSRRLQIIVDAVDYSPLIDNELFDANNAPGFGGYNANVSITYPFNNNLASSSASQSTLIDTTALRISGSGNATTHSDTQFDSADVSSGATTNTQSASTASADFKLNNSGKVHIALTLETATSSMDASGVPIAEATIQTATGTVLWHQLISATNQLSFTGDVPLATGSYNLHVTAASNMTDGKSGSRLIDTRATFTIDATIVEDVASGGGKKKK